MLTLSGEAMRTRFEIILADEDTNPADLRAAGEEALEEIARIEGLLSAFRPDADLYRINARGADDPVRVEARIFSFLQKAQEYSDQTDCAFDITVGPLLRSWNLSGGGEADAIPTEDEIEAALSLVGMRSRVILDEDAGTVRLSAPGVRLDPGAIGKGYALEQAAQILRDAGIRRALLHGGTSTICAIGAPPESADGWRIAIQHPQEPGRRLADVLLRDTSLSVSAVHGKSFYAQGRRFGHVIDPRTGWPVERSVLAAVLAPSPTDTDALSTALLVLGEAGIETLSRHWPDAGFLIAFEEMEGKSGLAVRTYGEGWRIGEDRPPQPSPQ